MNVAHAFTFFKIFQTLSIANIHVIVPYSVPGVVEIGRFLERAILLAAGPDVFRRS